MKNSNVEVPKPKIGFVVSTNGSQLVISNTLISSKSKVITFPNLRIRNLTGKEIFKGDKILYIISHERKDQPQILTVKKILAHNLPVSPTIKQLLSELKISLKCEKNVAVDVTGIQDCFKDLIGVSLNFIEEAEAHLIIKITERDEGTAFCPYTLEEILRRIDSIPFRIEVPSVSEKTITYLHRISEPVLEDIQLMLVVLSLRIIHMICHAVGYVEHVELSALADEYEARVRGDPSLAKQAFGVQCLMSWRNLHLLASKYNPSEGSFFSGDSPICKLCESKYAVLSMGFSDLETILEAIEGIRGSISKIRESELRRIPRYSVLYVLEKPTTTKFGVLFGISPIRSHQIIKASRATSLQELEMKMFNGVGLYVPSNLLEQGSEDTIQKGQKFLIEFNFDTHRSDIDFLLSSVCIIQRLSEKHKIYDTSSLLYKLGIGTLSLTIKIRWGSGVDKTVLQEAVEQVRRLTGWKVSIDERVATELDSVSSKMGIIFKRLESTSTPKEFKEIIYELQDLVDTIQPQVKDVIDKPLLMVYILPQFHYMPISTMGDVATGQTKSRIFSVLQMPGKHGPVHLISENCKECSKNYTEGRNYSYSNILSVFLIHEILHITAGLGDHRGECRLCYFDNLQMLPLRFSMCEKCIQNENNYVHENCLMSYACLLCIASRINGIKDFKDLLCDTCVSEIRLEMEYIHNFFERINKIIYYDLVAEASKKRLARARARS